ncbi:MAG: tRNA pseudouridine(13) synthase TruD [bacterium]
MYLPIINEKLELTGNAGELIKEVLDHEQINLSDFKLNKMRFRGVRFKSFRRRAIIIPEKFTITMPEDDEIYKNKKKILINVFLPSGSYATMLIKRLFL